MLGPTAPDALKPSAGVGVISKGVRPCAACRHLTQGFGEHVDAGRAGHYIVSFGGGRAAHIV
eukprot:4299167-Alexandrium_andersonii.AAC.1